MRTHAAVTGLLFAGVACSGTPAPQQPRVAAPPTLTFASPAARYNEPSEPPPSTTIADLLLGQVRDAAARAGRPAPIADERLFLASAAIATVTTGEGTIPDRFVDFALRTNGVIEPFPYLLVVWGYLYEPRGEANLKTLQPALDEIFRRGAVARVGVGAVVRGPRGYGAMVLTLLSSHVRTSPIPRETAADGAVDFELTIDAGLRRPWVGATLPDGTVEQVRAEPTSADTFTTRIECGGKPGKMEVEIRARSEHDSEALATFPVWCGVEPPRTFTITPRVNDVPLDPTKAERTIFDLVNLERRKLGRSPLQWDEGLATVAREHSQEMRRATLVGGQIRGGMSIEQEVRVIRGDVKTGSNVARAYGVTEAHQGLIDLPSTREKLISDAVTQIGVGIAYGQVAGSSRELYVTEVVTGPAADAADRTGVHPPQLH